MRQVFFILSVAAFLVACKGGGSSADAKKDLAGKYKMEMVLSEEELKKNPQAAEMMKSMKLESDLNADGSMYMNAEMMGQSRKDTAKWDVSGDSIIIFDKGKREAALMSNKSADGFTISQKSGGPTGDVITIKYIKQK